VKSDTHRRAVLITGGAPSMASVSSRLIFNRADKELRQRLNAVGSPAVIKANGVPLVEVGESAVFGHLGGKRPADLTNWLPIATLTQTLLLPQRCVD
jgi:hypothetical protein